MTHNTHVAGSLALAVLLTGFGPWLAPLRAQYTKIVEPAVPWDESEKLNKALDRVVDFPGLDDEKLDLGSVLEMLEKKYDVSINVNEHSFNAEDLDDILKTKIVVAPIAAMKNVPLRTVLKKILSRVPALSGVTYLVRRDTIEIMTRLAWYQALGLTKVPTSGLVKKQFKKIEIKDGLEELGEGVVIDVRVAKRARTKITARFYYVPADTVVELLADMAGLAVVHRDGADYITSPENAARMKKELAARPPQEPGDGTVRFRPGLQVPDSTQPGITLQRALEASGEERGINLVIDPRIEKKLQVPVSVRVTSIPTETALDLLADMASLGVAKKDNVYYVTLAPTPTGCARKMPNNLSRYTLRRRKQVFGNEWPLGRTSTSHLGSRSGVDQSQLPPSSVLTPGCP